jgi:hypothetical protein
MTAGAFAAALLLAALVRAASLHAAADVEAPAGLRGDAAAPPDAAAPAGTAAAGAAGAGSADAAAQAGSAATSSASAASTTEVASPVAVHGRVEPDTVTIGTHFRYTVEVTAPAGTEVVLSQPTEKIGDFDILDFGDAPPAKRDGKTVVTRWFTLVGWEPGYRLLESPEVQYRLPGKDLAKAPGDETVVTVESLLAKEQNASDIRDIKGPEAVPIDWRPYYAVAGGLAALLALGWLLYRILNRAPRTAAAPPPRPAHEVARTALAELRRRGLIEGGRFKEYYSTLSDIVRAYVERRFGVRAPEMTTEEFLLASARNGVLLGPHRALLGTFLSESDLVKFARHLPTIADSERAWEAAVRFVDETAAPAPSEGAGATR